MTDEQEFFDDMEYKDHLEDTRTHIGHIVFDHTKEEMRFMIDMDLFKDHTIAVDYARDILDQAQKLYAMMLEISRIKNETTPF